MARLLACIRLSVMDPETESPARQLAKITAFADANDHEIVAVAEDLDISGAVSPFDRPSLGPWLSDPDKITRWTALACARLDRVSRSVSDFSGLVDWLRERGKVFVCIDPPLDLSTPSGVAFAQVISVFAEFERATIGERMRQANHALRKAGQYPGGLAPFGYTTVKLDKGWGYELDPVYAPIVEEMAARYLAGWSLRMLVDDLNANRVPTSRNVTRRRNGKPEAPYRWTVSTVHRVLASPAVTGVMVADGEPLRDADGIAVQRAEPIISRDTWLQIKERLEANAGKKGPRRNASLLLQVAVCGKCESAMYACSAVTRGKTYLYYQCSRAREGKCPERKVRAELLEQLVEDVLLQAAGDVEMWTKIVHPAEDNTAEIARVEEGLSSLEDRYVTSGMSAERYTSTVTRLEARLERLRATESTPESVEYTSTGVTFSAHWEALENRNAWLREAGISVLVERTDDPDLEHPMRIASGEWSAPGRGYGTVVDVRNGIRVEVSLGELGTLRTLAEQR